MATRRAVLTSSIELAEPANGMENTRDSVDSVLLWL